MSTVIGITIEMLLMIGLPIIAGTVVCRRWRVPVAVPLIAAGFFLAQLVVNSLLTKALFPHIFGQGLGTILVSALTYGVFEETARYLSFRVGPLRRRRDTGGALAAGIGHGGMESIGYAVPYLVNAIIMTVAPSMFPPAAVSAFHDANIFLFLGTGADRIPAMLSHLVFAMMIVLAYRRGRRWLFAAIAAHALLDAVMFSLTAYAPAAVWISVWALVAIAAACIVGTVVRRGARDGVRDRSAVRAPVNARSRPAAGAR